MESSIQIGCTVQLAKKATTALNFQNVTIPGGITSYPGLTGSVNILGYSACTQKLPTTFPTSIWTIIPIG